ncbi:5-formyltetrahydrofolate cyclo-ligase [Paenibacillus sp. sgz500958]|uniref:5-formyltetrahydrofolate cyclo-ligase n=1 Tax=Paenibacillus sp. sgz500958 TaxID=3242475 RepID=UPI0036D2AB53
MSGNDVVLAEHKRALRRRQAAARDMLPLDQRGNLSSLVCKYAWNWLEQEKAASIMAYAAFRSELDTRPLIDKAWGADLRVFLPRVEPELGTMSPLQVNSWEEMIPGRYGIPEPSGIAAVPFRHMPDVIFVPGLAFDRRGGRLGYGQGYYDRLLAAWAPAAAKGKAPVWIGLAYGMQLVEEVPMDAHDAFMDILITEHGMIHCREVNGS